MLWSSTISLQVCASTPVLISVDVVAMTGNRFSGPIKLSSWALPSALPPVICATVVQIAGRDVRVRVAQRLAHARSAVDVLVLLTPAGN